MKTWKLVSYGDSSENFKRLLFKFSDMFPRKFTGVPRAKTLVYFWRTAVCANVFPYCRLRYNKPHSYGPDSVNQRENYSKPSWLVQTSSVQYFDQIWTGFFEKEPWKVKPPLKAPKESRDFWKFLRFFGPHRVEIFSQEYLNYSNLTWKRSLILKTRIFSKPRRIKNSPATGVMCFGGMIWMRLLAVWIPNQKQN